MIQQLLDMNNNKKFDVVLMNPPYLGNNRNDYNIHLKFLNKMVGLAKNICSVQPIMFLFKTYDKKSPERTEKEILSTIETHGIIVDELIKTQFDATFGNKIGIITINTEEKQDIVVNNKIYKSVKDINKFSHDALLVEFYNKIKPLYMADNIRQHLVYAADKRDIKGLKRKEEDSKSDKWFVNVAVVRGNKGKSDMFSIIPIQRISEYGKRPSSYINFNTKKEADNFINYCKTDFCSCSLYLFKNDLNLSPVLRYVPWFYFSDKHFSKSPKEIDNYLFNKYNMSDEIRKHIEEILPDYYNIR